MRNHDGSLYGSLCLLNEKKTMGERERQTAAGELNWKLEGTMLSRHPKCQRGKKNSILCTCIQAYKLFISIYSC